MSSNRHENKQKDSPFKKIKDPAFKNNLKENWNILTLASPETPNPSKTQETPECPASHSLAQGIISS